jgi:tensin
VNGEITAERKLAAVGHLLQKRHDGRYMVWNLSEVEYDVDVLEDQVLTFSFPGSPSPPLGLLLKILVSMEAWLKADDRNVAVVHCLTGKGRTSTVLAAFLCWMGQAGFGDVNEALDYIAACKQLTPDELTIPSQRRYASYFKNMLDGVRPSQPPLTLKRIIMSEAPRFARGPPRPRREEEDGSGGDPSKKVAAAAEEETARQMGCAPYLQIFKAGKLLHTVPATLHHQQASNELPFCQVADGSISFHVNLIVQGDILVRARHLSANKRRVSMFRAAFHTGYVPPNVMRLTKSQLDGACDDDRFPDDFFLDLIFEPVDTEEAGKVLQEQESAEELQRKETELSSAYATTAPSSADAPPAVKMDPKAGTAVQALVGGGNMVTASTYDTMLSRDSRFWDVIAARMEQHAKNEADEKQPHDPMWGSTVGRRRDFSAAAAKLKGKAEEGAEDTTAAATSQNALETFSIGGEFDFLHETVEPERTSLPVAAKKPSPPKKDSLMEALMGALDDENEDDLKAGPDYEEVIFEEVPERKTETTVEPTLESPESKTGIQDKRTEGEPVGSQEEAEVEKPPAAVTTAQTTESAPLPPSKKASSGESSMESVPVSDVEALLADANLNLGDDVDALLGDTANIADDDDLLDLDMDDAELEDLENFLSPKKP